VRLAIAFLIFAFFCAFLRLFLFLAKRVSNILRPVDPERVFANARGVVSDPFQSAGDENEIHQRVDSIGGKSHGGNQLIGSSADNRIEFSIAWL
jgi:hypothetical protein